jgi:hypothetical protein
MRAIDLSGLETGAFRPVELSDAFPKIMLSPLAIFALGPDAVIYGLHGPQGDGTRSARVRVVGFGLDGRGRYLARHDDVRRQADA